MSKSNEEVRRETEEIRRFINGDFKDTIQALEKQIPKKIEIFNGQASCPNCKCLYGPMDLIRTLMSWNMPYCKECGQKLDWSEEE